MYSSYTTLAAPPPTLPIPSIPPDPFSALSQPLSSSFLVDSLPSMAPPAAPTPPTIDETSSSLLPPGPNTKADEQFSAAFIASFLDTLLDEAEAAGTSGTAAGREEYGGAESSLLNGGWPSQGSEEGGEGSKEGDVSEVGSIFPAQQW